MQKFYSIFVFYILENGTREVLMRTFLDFCILVNVFYNLPFQLLHPQHFFSNYITIKKLKSYY